MVVHKNLKKVGRNVYGSGDTIVTKTSHFFQGLTLGAEGGGLYAVLYGTLVYNTVVCHLCYVQSKFKKRIT